MISLDSVQKAFGSKKALQGFSLEVPEGDTVAIIEARADVDPEHSI